MNYGLKDKVALVTGAGRGIGREIALSLAAEGCHIILFDVDENTLKTTAAEIETKGVKVLAKKVDISNSVEVENVIEEVCKSATGGSAEGTGKQEKDCIRTFPATPGGARPNEGVPLGIDILVNNAGITRDNLIMRMKEEEWDNVLNINLKGTFNCTKAVCRYMFKQRSGKIINIASVIGIGGNIGQANYAASKAGVIALTKSSAKEFASRNINVNAIAPGFIQTAMTEVLNEEVKKKMTERIPLQRLGTVKDVADAVLFFASDKSSYITGQVLIVDGGMLM